MLSFDLGGRIVGGQYFHTAQTAAFQPPSGGCYKDSGAHAVELTKVVVSLSTGPCFPCVTGLFPPWCSRPHDCAVWGGTVGGGEETWLGNWDRGKGWDEEEIKPKGRNGAAGGIDAPTCFSGPI